VKPSKIVCVQEEVKCSCREGGFDPTRFPIVHKSQNAGAVILVVSTRHEAYLRGLGGGVGEQKIHNFFCVWPRGN
jgi:hypothetical protein